MINQAIKKYELSNSRHIQTFALPTASNGGVLKLSLHELRSAFRTQAAGLLLAAKEDREPLERSTANRAIPRRVLCVARRSVKCTAGRIRATASAAYEYHRCARAAAPGHPEEVTASWPVSHRVVSAANLEQQLGCADLAEHAPHEARARDDVALTGDEERWNGVCELSRWRRTAR